MKKGRQDRIAETLTAVTNDFTLFQSSLSPVILSFITVLAIRWNRWNLWIKSSCYWSVL